jgi:hypothetical protein
LRLKWLEEELSAHYRINFADLPTGTSLTTILSASQSPFALPTRSPNPGPIISQNSRQGTTTPSSADRGQSYHSDEALSTTHENSSAEACFAAYIASFGRSFVVLPQPSTTGSTPHNPSERKVQALTSSDRRFLLQMYLKWVNSMYPLYEPTDFDERFLPLCNQFELAVNLDPGQRLALVLFYLVLANGAAYSKQAVTSQDLEERALHAQYERSIASGGISMNTIYEAAIEVLESLEALPNPTIPVIQVILLLLMYGSLQPSGNRQWQLAGMAIRVCSLAHTCFYRC